MNCAVETGRRPARRPLHRWVRVALVGIAALWVGVFAVACLLDPYRDGRVWLEETHRQLLLPPCTFKQLANLPCPSCGMSSSFALLVRGDLWHSVQANVVGAGLALVGLAAIPWSLVSAWRGRWLFIRRLEPVLIRLIVVFFVAMFVRWGIVLVWIWLDGS
jgi:hypothetical protein